MHNPKDFVYTCVSPKSDSLFTRFLVSRFTDKKQTDVHERAREVDLPSGKAHSGCAKSLEAWAPALSKADAL